jgi:hypothetical protein
MYILASGKTWIHLPERIVGPPATTFQYPADIGDVIVGVWSGMRICGITVWLIEL